MHWLVMFEKRFLPEVCALNWCLVDAWDFCLRFLPGCLKNGQGKATGSRGQPLPQQEWKLNTRDGLDWPTIFSQYLKYISITVCEPALTGNSQDPIPTGETLHFHSPRRKVCLSPLIIISSLSSLSWSFQDQSIGLFQLVVVR